MPRLTPFSRMLIVSRVMAGRPVAHVAAEMGVSRPTAYKWLARFEAEGLAGLADRSSRPRSSPTRTPAELEAVIAELRRDLKLGPVRIAARLGIPASTVHRVLVRLGINRLRWLDRPTGRVIRRYERSAPGELVHVDIKKLGRIPAGGGWRVRGRAEAKGSRQHQGLGYAFIHAAVDDHSRLAYAEVLADERADTAAGFWHRARRFYADHGIAIAEVLTDNGPGYRSRVFADALGAVRHRFTRPYRPQTNGKVERFNRTLLDEWGYVRAYDSETERTSALDTWLHTYNHHRCHTALGGHPPVSRVNEVPSHYT